MQRIGVAFQGCSSAKEQVKMFKLFFTRYLPTIEGACCPMNRFLSQNYPSATSAYRDINRSSVNYKTWSLLFRATTNLQHYTMPLTQKTVTPQDKNLHFRSARV
ncbi:MAG: hypothetical protein AAGK47_01890, partial [Bacteroidota bacterium]